MHSPIPLTLAIGALLFSSGAYAASGQDCSAAPTWTATAIYANGDLLQHEGTLYRATQPVWNAPPTWAGAADYYETLGRCGDGDQNHAPQVSIASPTSNTSIQPDESVHIAVNASDADGEVKRVLLFIDGTRIAELTKAPYALEWTPQRVGLHRLYAIAEDDSGAQTRSTEVAFTVVDADGGDNGADTWRATESYTAGCVVILGGRHYRAKWWANPGQSPADIDPAAPWNSPWEAIAATAPGCDTPTPPDPENPGDPGNPGDPEDPANPPPGDGPDIRLSELVERETQLTDFPLMKATLASIRTLDNAAVEAVHPLRGANPENVRRVERLFNETQFEHVFPMRAPEYTYRGLLQAFAKFPAICQTYVDGRDSDAICRKTLATMTAHFAQETGGHDAHSSIPEWRQALVHVREMGWNEQARGGYNGECNPATWQGKTWPCGTFSDGAFKSYFGRGAKQLSYNYNYGPFSEAMFGTVRTLLDKPELVADTWLNLASAAFFYMYPQPPKPSMLNVIDGSWQPNAHDRASGLVPGFGVTTQIINGGVECGGSAEHLQSQNRIKYYKDAAAYFGVPVPADEVLGCKGMKQFDEGGAGALPVYWEQDYSWDPALPGGRSYACKLVGYQTPFSAFKGGDYATCVMHHFPDANYIDDLDSTR